MVEKYGSLDGFSAHGATVVRLDRDPKTRRYLATVHHDNQQVASISEATPAAALVSVGRVLGALLLSSSREALTNELANAIARDLRMFGGRDG